MEVKSISEFADKDIGKEFFVIAQVMSIRQTSGPTLFDLKDNSGRIKATGFSRAGERAFPNLILGDNIQAKVMVKERTGKMELEILSFNKITEPVIKKPDLNSKQFMISSENLEKLRENFIKAADAIRDAVQQSRPVIIRHHDDPDGYAAGIVLEKALMPLVQEVNPEKPYLYLTRIACRTPYYDYIDGLKDLNTYLSGKQRYDMNPPMIILADLGSNSQSIKSIKRLKIHCIDFVIVDHHKFDKENIDSVAAFLNPIEKKLEHSICGGILASELALFLNPDLNGIRHLPALAAVADKSEGKDIDEYIKLSGYTRKELVKWSTVIDHELYYLKFNESQELLEDLFFPGETNSRILELIYPEIEKEIEQVKKAAKEYCESKKMNNMKIITVSKSDVVGYGDYASSKLTRIAHELYEGPRVTIAITEDSISFRADGVPGFSVPGLLSELMDKFPYALLEGGGHDVAGTIKFNAASIEKITRYVKEYIERLSKKI
ncbi:hypothetical protein JXC34_04035 [Candidatus Woesearchaeota archaeon]|nr:hypothetical protein [Candidatus Woesearchaeota archaeon]